jgi:hypothetical protein
MSVVTISVVSGAIAIGFYCVNNNKDFAHQQQNQTKLRESTAMVFILSASVMLLAKFMGIGEGTAAIKSSTRGGGGSFGGVGGGSVGPALSYMLKGDPPF